MKTRDLFETLSPALRDLNPHLTPAPPPRRGHGRPDALDALRLAAVPPSQRAQLEEALAAKAHHAATGAASHEAGESLEDWCDAQHQDAIENGYALWIEHIGAPSVPHVEDGRARFDGRGRMLAAITGTAPPDYLGVTRDHLLVIEAKHRTGRLHRDRELPNGGIDRAGIARHQRDALTAFAASRVAIVLVVVEFVRAAGATRYAVPWTVLDSLWTSVRGGPPSVGPAELAPWKVVSPCYLVPFLEGGP